MSFEQGTNLEDGRYELRRRIGSGGMASVWLAQDTRLQRSVAIKIPAEGLAADPVFARRFEREARLAASLSHPNLVPVYDYGCEGERPFLVMEYIDGDSLAALREREQSVDGASLARALLGALEPIHAAGIVHRDVKPGNVLVEHRDGRILLTDFGIAQAAEASRLTGTGQVIGTLRYIAPEVMDGKRASPRSDLYACGVLLAEFLEPDAPQPLRRLADELSSDDPDRRPDSATSALAMVPPPVGSVDGVERATAIADPTEELAFDPEPTPIPEDPEPTPIPLDPEPAEPPRRPTRSPASVVRSETMPPAAYPPPSRPPERSRSGVSMLPRLLLVLVAIGAAAAIAVAVISASGDDGDNGTRVAQQDRQGGGGNGDGTAAEEEAPAEEAPPEEAPVEESAAGIPPPSPTPDPVRGEELNAQGYALFNSGDYEAAVPVLAEAVSSYPADSTDPHYGYALYNYGMALLESGDAEAAIAPLEKRLEFPEDHALVRQQIARARAEAGGG